MFQLISLYALYAPQVCQLHSKREEKYYNQEHGESMKDWNDALQRLKEFIPEQIQEVPLSIELGVTSKHGQNKMNKNIKITTINKKTTNVI